mgnify:CR=1 FL=1
MTSSFLGLTVPFLIKSQNCGDLRVHLLPQNSFTEVVLTTNYDSLVNLNPNITTVSGIYDWRAYPPGSHNWNGNTHIWQSTVPSPTYSVTFNDDNIFSAPAFPLEKVFDPTGAGDTFAGAAMGY